MLGAVQQRQDRCRLVVAEGGMAGYGRKRTEPRQSDKASLERDVTSQALCLMRSRRWIKGMGASLIGIFMLIYAAHWLLRQPWWWKEAGPPSSLFSDVKSWGTGSFVTLDGWVLTNRHVTAGCSRVTIGNGRLSGLVADKMLYPTDTQLDLAAVHVALRSPAYLRFAVMAWPSPDLNSGRSTAEIAKDLQSVFDQDGRTVSIIGFPGDYHGASPVHLDGELSGATTFDQQHWFLGVRAPVRPGLSGSPILNAKGEVVGMIFRGSATLPADSSAAVMKEALKALPTSAAEGLIVPAAIANAFVRAVAPSNAGQGEEDLNDPDTSIVRVFCFQ